MRARVTVTLKPGILDPQGKAIEGALASLGIEGVAEVRQGKVFDVDLATDDTAEAETLLQNACERLLANTVVERYRVEVDGASGKRKRRNAAEQVAEPEPSPAPEPGPDPTLEAAEHAEMPVEGHP